MKNLFFVSLLFYFSLNANSFRIYNVADINGNENIITEIDLSNKGLTFFPTEILKCENLVSLNLSNNAIRELPLELGQLSNLRILNLSQNRTLEPTHLENLFNEAKFKLNQFFVADCKLLFIPSSLSAQTELTHLDLSLNRLTALPYGMMSLSKLKEVNLSSNYLQNIAWIVTYWWSLKSIDFSNNQDLQVSGVLASLSYFDRLEEVTFSKLDFFPKDFILMNVDKLTIKNSTIDAFPRSSLSTKIKQLYFENCQFEKSATLVSTLNQYVKPEYIHFSKSDPENLVEFLNLKADSVTLFELGVLDIRPLKKNESLKWLDVRGNILDQNHIVEFNRDRPDVDLLYQEPVKPDFGVNPPIAEFVSVPVIQKITTGTTQVIEFGKSTFEIPAQGILDQNGNVYNGSVNLSYREFTTPAEIMLSGITMTSESENGETMIFSSAGMFELNATDDEGKALSINPEQPIQVKMETWTANPEMEMYRLNESGSWEKTMNDSVLQPYQFNELKLDSVMNPDFIKSTNSQVIFTRDRYVPQVKRNRKTNSFEITFKEFKTWGNHKGITVGYGSTAVYNPNLTAQFLCTQRLIFEGDEAASIYQKIDSISNYCNKKYKRLRLNKFQNIFYSQSGPDFISQINLRPDLKRDCFILNFKFKNEAFSLPVSVYSDESGSASTMRKNRNFFAQYINAWKKTKKIENTNLRELQLMQSKKNQVLRKKIDEERIKALKINYLDKSYFNQSQFGARLLSSLGIAFQILTFGIHNSDSRARIPKPEQLSDEFVNDAQEKISSDPEDIYVIDHSINGVIQYEKGDKLMFNKLSNTSLVVFFASGLVGIYHTWMNNRSRNQTELQLVNPKEISRENFIKRICYEK